MKESSLVQQGVKILVFLTSQAIAFRNTLFTIDWPSMSSANKKRLLLLMTGSSRVVNIRAGGTYELNLALFAQVGDAFRI